MIEKNKLREWREINKLTLDDASKILELHISHLSMLERGKRMPNLKLALKIDKATYGFVTPYDWM